MDLETRTIGGLGATADRALGMLVRRSAAPVLAIAGTSGKSTTAALAAAMLRASGRRVTLGLGDALGVASFLGPRDRVVIELTPAVAAAAPPGLAVVALTGVAVDELDPGQSLYQLVAGLRPAIASAQTALVVNADDAQAMTLAATAAAPVWRTASHDAGACAWLRDGELVVRDPEQGIERRVCRMADTRLGTPGLTTDLLVAALAALALGARPEDIRRVALHFEPGAGTYRVVGVRRRVRWIVDAAATRPGRTAAAMAHDNRPLVLIAGGQHGGQPLRRWARAVDAHVGTALLFGSGADVLAQVLVEHGAATTIVRCADLADAVLVARRAAEPGGTVLFSPGCEPDELGLEAPGELFCALVRARHVHRREAA